MRKHNGQHHAEHRRDPQPAQPTVDDDLAAQTVTAEFARSTSYRRMEQRHGGRDQCADSGDDGRCRLPVPTANGGEILWSTARTVRTTLALTTIGTQRLAHLKGDRGRRVHVRSAHDNDLRRPPRLSQWVIRATPTTRRRGCDAEVATARETDGVEQPEVVDAYLDRLGVAITGRPPGRALLSELQAAHLMKIPFENLDVFHHRGVTTDSAASVAKIVERGRGGWCYELNGAFGWLLGQIGFTFDYVSCRVNDGTRWGPDRDHCAIIVRMGPDRLFVDVGFGDAPMAPIPMRVGEHAGIPRRMRVRTDVGGFVMAEFGLDERWADKLWISISPRSLDDFTARSTFLQNEPGNWWTAAPFATRASAPDGSRITLRSDLYRVRVKGADHDDTPVAPGDWSAVLAEHFGLTDTL